MIISLSPRYNQDGDKHDAKMLVDIDSCFENRKEFVYL